MMVVPPGVAAPTPSFAIQMRITLHLTNERTVRTPYAKAYTVMSIDARCNSRRQPKLAEMSYKVETDEHLIM
jgi:hypothetical protein